MRLACTTWVALLVAGPASAGVHGVVVWDNDSGVMKLNGSSDRDYTNGVALGLLGRSADLAAGLERLRVHSDTAYFGVSVAQRIFTPWRIARVTEIPNDRPYAGDLAATGWIERRHGATSEVVTLTLGVLGPSSQAGRVQVAWHEATGQPIPRGWAYQLPDAPVVQVGWRRVWRCLLSDTGDERWLAVDVLPEVDLHVGTLSRAATASTTLRVGPRLPHDGGPVGLSRPGAPGIPPGWSGYAWGAVDVSVVQHDALLEGSRRSVTTGVDARPLVARSRAGVVVAHGGERLHVSVQYSQSWSTRTFDTQRDLHGYGSVLLSAGAPL